MPHGVEYMHKTVGRIQSSQINITLHICIRDSLIHTYMVAYMTYRKKFTE